MDYHKTGPTKGCSLHRRTNYFHHCTSLQSPTASEQLAEVRAYNGQQVNKRTMYRKCTKSVQKMHKICTAAAQWPEHTGVEWGGPCVPILLSSLVSQIPRLSVFTIFQLPFNCRLSDHPRLPIFNFFSIVIKHNTRISMGLVSFQFAFTTQTLAIKSVVSHI